mgnify:CR=1 FL=1
MRIGHGYDVHKFAENRKLILGGTEIPYEFGLLGHSDADVLVHAVMDSLLGVAALGDIGKHFPDTDERYKGADSIALLKEVCRILDENGYKIGNIDSTVIELTNILRPAIVSINVKYTKRQLNASSSGSGSGFIIEYNNKLYSYTNKII